jgi:hypothetical protein
MTIPDVRVLTPVALPCAGAMASLPAGGASEAVETLDFLKWPMPSFDEERLLMEDSEVGELLPAHVAVRIMYTRDPEHASNEVKARLAFIAAGYVPVTEEGHQALMYLWHSWVATNLGSRTLWSDNVKEYITAGTQLLLGLEPDFPEHPDPPANGGVADADGDQHGTPAGTVPSQDKDGDVTMRDTEAKHMSQGVTIPPPDSLRAGASTSSGHRQVVRDGVVKLKLDLSVSGSSDPNCFQRIDTVDDGGETLRELRQRYVRCINQSSKVKALVLPSVSAEDVTQFLKRVRLESVKLLENAELGDAIRYPDLDPENEMVALVCLRIMETKLVASIQTHLPKPLTWDGLVAAVNTQVASQRKPSYFLAQAREVRSKVGYNGGDSKWSAFMNQFRTRFETFSEQMKCEDKSALEAA